MTWSDGDNKGGVMIQADKNEYRRLAVDSDLEAKKSTS